MQKAVDATFSLFNNNLPVAENQNFSHLYDVYSKPLNKFIQRYVHSEIIAEDIVQDIFVKIWSDRGKFGHILEPEAYLFRMAKNASLDYLKKIKKIELLPDEIIREFKNYNNGVENLAQEKEYFAFLKHQLAKLPETSQKIFNMCREQGKSYDEVSAELNISRNTVKHHMVATMKALKKNVLEKLKIYGSLKILLIIFIEKLLP